MPHQLKQQNKLALKYINEMFTSADKCKIKLDRPVINWYILTVTENVVVVIFRTKTLGAKLWNNLLIDTELSKNPNICKHKVKMHFFEALVK